MLYRTALLEFATLLKVGTAAMQGLTKQEGPSPDAEEIVELLRQAEDIADRLSALGGTSEDDPSG